MSDIITIAQIDSIEKYHNVKILAQTLAESITQESIDWAFAEMDRLQIAGLVFESLSRDSTDTTTVVDWNSLKTLAEIEADADAMTVINASEVARVFFFIYTAKSVILDIADNWGNISYIGVRSVDFWYAGSKILNLEADFTAYATNQHSDLYLPKYVFDTSVSKTGVPQYTCWINSTSVIEQRLICVFDIAQTFDEIRINNYQDNEGTNEDRGAKNVKITISTDAISNTTYNAAIANSTIIYNSTFDKHVAADVEDEQILTLL